MVVPVSLYFSPASREANWDVDVLVYGPAHLLRLAFQRGAHDYLKEPWTADELFVRAGQRGSRRFRFDVAGWQLVLDGGTLSSGDRRQELTSSEAQLLAFLVQRQGKTVSVAALGHQLYGVGPVPESRVLATLISRLRGHLRRLTRLPKSNPILSFRGDGYRLP